MPWIVAGSNGGIGVHLELPAVPGVGAPAPGQPQAFADLGAQQRPCHRQQIRSGPLGGHPGDGVAGVLVGIGDPFQDRLQHRQALRRIRRRGLTGHGDHSAVHPKPWCAARQAAQNLPRPGIGKTGGRAHARTSAVHGAGASGPGVRFRRFAPWPGGGGSRRPAPVASRTAYAPAPEVTGWPEQSRNQRGPRRHGRGRSRSGEGQDGAGRG